MKPIALPRYAELHCLSNFSFLKGASHPEELVLRATELGYAALAITDECSLAGVVRAHAEAKQSGLKLLVGSSFVLEDGLRLVVIASNREGYGNLSELITLGRMRCPKGSYRLTRADFDGSPQPAAAIPASCGTLDHLAGLPDCLVLWIPTRDACDAELDADARWFASTFRPRDAPDPRPPDFVPTRAWIGFEQTQRMDDRLVATRLRALAERSGLPCVATGHVHMHARSRKPLCDTLTAIRLNRPVAECGDALAPNAERHLRTRGRLARLFLPAELEATVTIANQCAFSMTELGYQYPKEIVPAGETQTSYLRRLTEEGLVARYPQHVIDTLPPGAMDEVRQQIEHELALIADLRYEAFFLTVHDIVRYARSVGILCQGRGSAANSAVCFCLGITEVDPTLQKTLFERFLTKERNEPPDIDVDFEHQRREEVIQYIFDKYGRHRTALAATVIAYRSRSAIRDVGRALGLDAERIDRLSASHAWWDGGQEARARLEENGFDPDSPVVQKLAELTATLRSFPRHLSQHVGGFVISADKLSRMVPIENAAMERPKDWDEARGRRTVFAHIGENESSSFELPAPVAEKSDLFPTFRSVIQWDKDDLEELGLLKVDVLALGMLSAMRRALELCSRRYGRPFSISDVPKEDPATYDMICKADTIGVFQIESRAQMSMLPRLLPQTFYDLVVEVAIVRPGPIQGGMVHPYLKAREAVRNGRAITYPKPAVKQALERTLGVPIFQEQVMQLMMLSAKFTAGEADQLRRAMAAWKRKGGLGPFEERIVEGMVREGYERDYAERIFRQVEGFGEYGFPESHAASFAFLVYVSCWIKRHEPAVFLASMLNSQPLGFYSSSQLIQDAQRHDVEVRPIDVTVSGWDATLEEIESLTEFAARRETAMVVPAEPAPARGAPGAGTRSPPFEAHGRKRLQPAVRLGFNSVKSFGVQAACRLVAAREERPFASVEDLGRRAGLSTLELEALAAADALAGLAGHRREARWQAAPHRLEHDLMRDAAIDEATPQLPFATEGQEIVDDYAATGFTLRRHPLALLRPRLTKMGLLSARELHDLPNGRFVRTTGIVTVRQRPGTAKGTIFVTLEDETGVINVIVWNHVSAAQRAPLLSASLLTTHGTWQRQGEVRHVVAQRFFDHSHLIGRLAVSSRDFH
jgi:error-prone DNA polymerase